MAKRDDSLAGRDERDRLTSFRIAEQSLTRAPTTAMGSDLQVGPNSK